MRFVQAGVLLLGAALYVLFLLPFAGDSDRFDVDLYMNLLMWSVVGWNLALLVATILVIIDSVKKVRKGMTAELANAVVTVKLAAIPFFLINFVLLAMIGFLGFVLSLHGIGIPIVIMVAIAAVLTYLAMVSTSVYGWASVIRLRRERRIGIARTIFYPILLLVFVADIAVGIALWVHVGPRRARGRVGFALAVVLVETLAVLTIPGYLVTDWHLAWLSDIFLLAIVVTIIVTAVLVVRRRRLAKSEAGQELESAQPDEG